jgi:HD-GYP domain-containing protein (c-di-GMP phosphodiesterase class II)
MVEINVDAEKVQEFQSLLAEATRSVTRRGLQLIGEDPERFAQMHARPFPAYIPELAEDLQTPAFFDALEAANDLFGTAAQYAGPGEIPAWRAVFRQCLAATSVANHWPLAIDDHTWRSARIAVAIGKELGLPQSTCCELFWGAWFHDVGKQFILELAAVLEAQKVQFKSILPLIRTHASLGGLLMERVSPLFALGEICAGQHQESVDGTGYPYGLSYGRLTTEGRIVNMSDAYDATVTRSGWSASQICDDCRQQYTSAGHPEDAVLLAFIRVVERYHQPWYS